MEKYCASILTLLLIVSLSGCDIIEQPYSPPPPPPPPNQDSVIQKVLLIEYTAYRCGNCPKGAAEMAKLHDYYGDKLVEIAMHTDKHDASPDGSPEFAVDFRTPESEELYKAINGSGQPTGSVNFVPVSGKLSISKEGWSPAIANELLKKPQMSIEITPTFTNDSILTVKADVRYLQAGSNQRLAVYLVEDSVVYAQIDFFRKPELIPNYIHRHVFRGSIGGGGTYGEKLPPASAGDVISKKYTFDFKGLLDYSGNPITYNPRHCSVVVSVNDIDTKNTLQVEEAPILK